MSVKETRLMLNLQRKKLENLIELLRIILLQN